MLPPPFNLDALSFYSYRVARARTSNAMLNGNGQRGHTCLLLILEQELSLAPLSMMSTGGFSHTPFNFFNLFK